MRVPPPGNLTVELIRHARFDPQPALPDRAFEQARCEDEAHDDRADCMRIDAVRFSPAVLACAGKPADQPLIDSDHQHASSAEHSPAIPRIIEPAKPVISPVVGSPALAGLGVALVVPGTLLDVVA